MIVTLTIDKAENRCYLFVFFTLVMASAYTTFFRSNTTIAVLFCVVSIAFIVMQTNQPKTNSFFVIWFNWNLINILHMSYNTNSYFLRVLIFQNIVIAFVYLASQYRCSETQFKTTYKVISAFTTVLCIISIIFSLSTIGEGFSFILFGLMYFFICEKKMKKCIKFVLMATAFWVGKNRSSILMLLLCSLFYQILKKQKSKRFYKVTFFIVATITYLIPHGYVLLYHSPRRNYLNELSYSIFGKKFFSGRNILWIQIYDWLGQYNPLFGIGGEFVGGMYAKKLGMSTHNATLFLLGQGGLILLLLFFFMMYKIYMSFFVYKDDDNVVAGAAFILGLMIRSDFDLILIANQFIPSMYSWLSIALVMSYCNYLNKKNQVLCKENDG